MDFLIGGVADLINSLASTLPTWSFVHDISVDVALLTPYFQKANVLLPVDTMLEIFALLISLELMLIAFYWIMRIINLIRGAG